MIYVPIIPVPLNILTKFTIYIYIYIYIYLYIYISTLKLWDYSV